MDTSSVAANPPGYQLSDELARLCLPQEFKDSYRNLAWVNSICCLFLMVGLVGLKPPPVIVRPVAEPVDIMPVELPPPAEDQKPDPQEEKPEEVDQSQPAVDTPTIVTVVAPAGAPNVAFEVPVQGAVRIAATATFVPPPPPPQPPARRPEPKAIEFNPRTAGDGGFYPQPQYPQAALRNRYQGTAILELRVDASGAITNATVRKTSGYNLLDDAGLETVKNRWRFPPGEERWYTVPIVFQLK